MLIHSCIYYVLGENLISDETFDCWAKELLNLQNEYPDISKEVIWADAFEDWNGCTGAFLPLRDPWVVSKAQQILKYSMKNRNHPQL